MTFRAPDTSKAKHRRATGGWDPPSQREKAAKWFAECWEVITGTLLGEISDLTETQDNLKKGKP